MSDNYKKIVCIIKNRDCDDANNCDDCYIAIEERKREQEEINSRYIMDKSVKINGIEYARNYNCTVIKTEISMLENIKNVCEIDNPKEIFQDKYHSVNLERYYPEWEKTKQVLNITEIPDKFLFEKDKPLIVFFGKEIYVVAPRFEE